MIKKFSIMALILNLSLILFVSGCLPQAPPTENINNQPVQVAPPDYSVVDAALEDPSLLVRYQAVKNLVEIKHEESMKRLVKAIKENPDYTDLVTMCIVGITPYAATAVPVVKEELWNDKSLSVQKAGFTILSQISNNEEFYKEAQDKFYSAAIQNDPLASAFKLQLATYLLANANRELENTIPDIVAMLQLPDDQLSKLAQNTLAVWKDQRVIEPIFRLYSLKQNDPHVVKAILTVLYTYDAPGPKIEKETVLNDISIFLDTFGAYNRDVQNLSYVSLKKFAYNDPDGLILEYLKRFENCDDEVIRTHVLDLMQVIPKNQIYPGFEPPTFEIPKKGKKKGYCA